CARPNDHDGFDYW
nr:immunoglobulin heavy chain junction region [Macaca mulatta]MOV45244.1 immunoglobulin heavy chain junction region [Macaca mulatta]